jgi:hypothetical protein
MKPYGRNKCYWTTYPRKTHNRLSQLKIWDDWSDIYISKKSARQEAKKDILSQLYEMEEYNDEE